MGLPKIIQIPCHHVLSNQNDLKFKKRAPLKLIFNINLGIGIKKLLFLFVFSTYFPMFLLKFRLGEIVGCRIKLCIQRVPTQVFLAFWLARSIKSMSSGYSLDAKFNSAYNKLSSSKFE